MGRRSQLPDLLVVHTEGRAARATIERLSRAGVDGGLIELLRGSEVVTAGRYRDRQVDLGTSLALAGRVLRGVAFGMVPGGVFGALLLALVAGPDGLVIAAGAGGGALFGGAVGILASLLGAPTMAASWERTFAPMVPGAVVVGVRVDGLHTQRRARRALARARGITAVREVGDLDELTDDPDRATYPPPE